MQEKYISWFNKPYYFTYSPKNKFIISGGFGLFIFLFLFIFQPFQMHNLNNNLLYYTLGFGLITFFVLLLTLFVFPIMFPWYFRENFWTVGKHAVFLIVSISIISISNWFYNTSVQDGDIAIIPLYKMILYTLSVGALPILVYLIIDEKLSRNKRQKIAEEINSEDPFRVTTVTKSSEVIIASEETKEQFKVNVNNLIYVSSEGNYASLFLSIEEGLKEIVIRTTLTNIEDKLNEYKHIIRCHKSYIVNTNFVKKVSGNARGYLLCTEELDFNIPVSRKFKKQDILALITT